MHIFPRRYSQPRHTPVSRCAGASMRQSCHTWPRCSCSLSAVAVLTSPANRRTAEMDSVCCLPCSPGMTSWQYHNVTSRVSVHAIYKGIGAVRMSIGPQHGHKNDHCAGSQGPSQSSSPFSHAQIMHSSGVMACFAAERNTGCSEQGGIRPTITP